jgi:hypothetical protein
MFDASMSGLTATRSMAANLAPRPEYSRVARHHRPVVIRWTVVVLGVVLGVLLIVDGYPLIGGPIILLAIARAVMLVRWLRHPERHRPPHHGYSDPG